MPESMWGEAAAFLTGHQSVRTLTTAFFLMTMLVLCSVARLEAAVPDIPKDVHGWLAATQVRTYDRKTLFKYIDGGAELYLAYGFREVHVYTYTRAGQPDIIMGIYDMGTAKDAFGVFTSEREGDDIGIGQESEYEAGLLRFYQGQFFVSIMTFQETSQSKQAVFSLARAVADAVESTGERPQLVSALPQAGLIKNSIRYFYRHTLLNLHYYVADENILLLDSTTEAVLAQYAADGQKAYLLLVQYPSNQGASTAFISFVNAYMPEATKTGLVQTENGKWTAAQAQSRYVTVVFDAASDQSARLLLEAAHERLEVAN